MAAVSAGGDSVAMLHLLAALAPGRGWQLEVATLDHGLRGDEGAADVRFVERQASGLGLVCHAERLELVGARGSVETRARQLRREFLRRTAASVGAKAIALGHTLDDQAETVLFRLGRGCGLLGLGAMERWSAPFWRPLLRVRRDSLRRLLRDAGLAWREDSSNQSLRPTRNKLRHRLVPVLIDVLGPSAIDALGRAAELARDDERLLAHLADQSWVSIVSVRGARRIELDRRALGALPPPLARRVVRRAIETASSGRGRLAARHIEAALALARAQTPGLSADLPGKVCVFREGRQLVVENRRSPSEETVPRQVSRHATSLGRSSGTSSKRGEGPAC
ncbi:MAG: tRNA lysidine(34) synthetase TilS [Acidobacteriota bacterium]|nr:MAG: tRNA lysidine(34) synthetase TilS [Acidobacteriota bacterium]